MKTTRDPVDVSPLSVVPVELLDPIRDPSLLLETVRVFVARPSTGLGVEKESLLVFLADVVVEVLSQGELAVQLGWARTPNRQLPHTRGSNSRDMSNRSPARKRSRNSRER
jgi:hypothetical protein